MAWGDFGSEGLCPRGILSRGILSGLFLTRGNLSRGILSCHRLKDGPDQPLTLNIDIATLLLFYLFDM